MAKSQKIEKYLLGHSGLDPESSAFRYLRIYWIPAFAGMTPFYETVNNQDTY